MVSLNWNKQFALEQAGDDADLLQELLDLFKQTCVSDISLIINGLKNHDAQQVRSAAHAIKGAAASLGMHGIRDLALAIETAAREGDLTVVRGALPDLESLGNELARL